MTAVVVQGRREKRGRHPGIHCRDPGGLYRIAGVTPLAETARVLFRGGRGGGGGFAFRR